MIKKQTLFIEKSFSALLLIFFISCENNIIKNEKIDLGDGNFLLPGPKNKDGCTEYQLLNEDGLPTTQMIYYVDRELNISGSYDKTECI